jgi:hypothetical protein
MVSRKAPGRDASRLSMTRPPGIGAEKADSGLSGKSLSAVKGTSGGEQAAAEKD